MKKSQKNQRKTPDYDETKTHILNAARELLLAANGALSFCRSYVESSLPKESQPKLLEFFQKAIYTADELSKGFYSLGTVKAAAKSVAKPVFEAIEKEMASGCRCAPRSKVGHKAKRKRAR